MVMSPAELGHKNDYAGDDQQQLQITDPPSRQKVRLTCTNPQLCDNNKNLVLGSVWGLTTGQTGGLAVCRKMTLTLLMNFLPILFLIMPVVLL
jgi:hypothetical protein